MICQITGKLLTLAGNAAHIEPGGVGIVYEVLVPAYIAQQLERRLGSSVTLTTLQYLEAQGQGSSFIPRLIGFETASDRRFFEVFTTVKGIGNRKALRALAITPAAVARAIAGKDAAALTRLPEIGKRLAETIVAELHGKVDAFLSASEIESLDASAATAPLGPDDATTQAVDALVALGETRADAERAVRTAITRAGTKVPRTADEIVGLVYAGR